jgi:hypothetical protein
LPFFCCSAYSLILIDTYIHRSVIRKLAVQLSSTNENVFFKNGEQEGKIDPVLGFGTSGREEGECSGNIIYS